MTIKEADESRKSSREIRQARVRRLVRRMLLWVVLPTLAGIIYYSFLVSSQYESVALFTVQSNKSGKTSVAKQDAMLVREYALSRAMLDRLLEHHDFKKHYQGSGGDFISRLSSSASSEDIYEYYLDKVKIEYLPDSGSLRLRLRAFSGQAAQRFAQAILQASEEMANANASDARADRLALAQEHVSEAENELQSTQARLSALQLQNAAQDSVPEPAVDTNEKSVTGALRAGLEAALFKRDLAQERYQEALSALEKTRVTNLEEHLYIATISPPSLANGAAYPRRLWGILTVFVLAFVFMGVITMLSAAVQEHARF